MNFLILCVIALTVLFWDWWYSIMFFEDMVTVRLWRKLFPPRRKPPPTEADYRAMLGECLAKEPALQNWPPATVQGDQPHCQPQLRLVYSSEN